MGHFTFKLLILVLLGFSALLPSAEAVFAKPTVAIKDITEQQLRAALRQHGLADAEIETIIQRGGKAQSDEAGIAANGSSSGIYANCSRGAVAYFHVDAGAFQHWFETSYYSYQDYYSGYSSGSWYTAYSSNINTFYNQAIVYGNNAGHAGAYCQ